MQTTAASLPAPPRTLGPRASFWVAAAVVVHTLWTSAAPAMTYPLYRTEWHLTPTMTTAIFAVYPLFVVAVLILLGDLSDYIGRRTTMLLGLGASLLGVLLFAVARDIGWVFVGRAFMGIGVGLSASPSAAAVVEFSPPGQAGRAGALTASAQALGLAAAVLVGGALIEYAPFPTRLDFWVLFAFIAAVFAAAWFLPRHTAAEASGPWRPKVPSVPAGLRSVFLVSATAVATGYALGAIMLSLGSQIARDLIGSGNAFVNGAALAFFALMAGAAGITAKRLPSRPAMIAGGVSTALGMAFLALASARHSLPLFLVASVGTGVGYSLLFLGGLNLVNAHAPAHHRGGTLSAVFLVAYLTQGTFALLLGRSATAWGLKPAVEYGSLVLALAGLVAGLLALLSPLGSRPAPVAARHSAPVPTPLTR